MNRGMTLAAAVLVAAIAVAGTSYADSLGMNDGPQIERTLVTFDKPFDVRYLNDYQNQKTQPDPHGAAPPRTAEGVKNIQASIKANKELTKKLEAKGISVENVVNAEQAADGSITFFIR